MGTSSRRADAASNAGDPPKSNEFAEDEAWWQAQDAWVSKFEVEPWYEHRDPRRRNAWKAATREYWRLKSASGRAPASAPAAQPEVIREHVAEALTRLPAEIDASVMQQDEQIQQALKASGESVATYDELTQVGKASFNAVRKELWMRGAPGAPRWLKR